MPRLSLSLQQRRNLVWRCSTYRGYWSEARNAFLTELVRDCSTVINIGPRGGTTWGTDRMSNDNYQKVKEALARQGYKLVEDRATRKVHLRVAT